MDEDFLFRFESFGRWARAPIATASKEKITLSHATLEWGHTVMRLHTVYYTLLCIRACRVKMVDMWYDDSSQICMKMKFRNRKDTIPFWFLPFQSVAGRSGPKFSSCRPQFLEFFVIILCDVTV